MRKELMAFVLFSAVAGCTTTEEANQAMKSRFIGQPSDSFFSQYGAPQTAFPLNNGGTVYRWRGGETVRSYPAEYKTVETKQAPLASQTQTTTKTTLSQPAANTTLTRTTTTSYGVGAAQPSSQQVMVRPARNETLFCEAQITTDSAGLIVNIEATRDTDGAGFSLSRCAEVFGVK